MARLGPTLVAHVLALASSVTASVKWDARSLRTICDPGRDYYCYAPSAFIDDAGREHVFACRNRDPRVIRDHLYVLSSMPTLVLSPGGDGAWDSYHVCDPSVIAGSFKIEGVACRYAMFYLGNNVDASRDNQIGVAFARDIAGPWIRYPKPIIEYPPSGHWGAGQPSAISLDRAGKVLLFYTSAGPLPRAFVREMDLSDLSKPMIGDAVAISAEGLVKMDGKPDWLNNFDVALDKSRRRFIAVREQHPYPRREPHFIGANLEIVSMPAADLRKGAGVWRVEASIGPELTHFPRNHNAALVRTRFGTLPEAYKIRVIFTTSDAEPQLNGAFAAWTYVLREIDGMITEP